MCVRGTVPPNLAATAWRRCVVMYWDGVLQRNVGPREIENATVGVVEGRGQVVGELALKHDPQAVGIERLAGVAEGSRRNIGQQESASSGDFAGAGECGIDHPIGEYGDLDIVLAGIDAKR